MLRTVYVSQDLPDDVKEKLKKELRLGFLNLSEGEFEAAKQNFQLSLEYDDKCAEAYWGLALGECEIKNESELYSNPNKFKDFLQLKNGQLAVGFASEEQKKFYMGLLEKIFQINEGNYY